MIVRVVNSECIIPFDAQSPIHLLWGDQKITAIFKVRFSHFSIILVYMSPMYEYVDNISRFGLAVCFCHAHNMSGVRS